MEYRISEEIPHVDAVFLSPVAALQWDTPYLQPTHSEPRQGDLVVAMGYSVNGFFWDEFLVTGGILSGSNQLDRVDYLVLDVFSSGGGSGSPVFGNGELIGMITHAGFYVEDFGEVDGFSYAISLVGESLP